MSQLDPKTTFGGSSASDSLPPLPPDHLSKPQEWVTGNDPATSKQVGFIKVLEKQHPETVPEGGLDVAGMQKAEASETIEKLKGGESVHPTAATETATEQKEEPKEEGAKQDDDEQGSGSITSHEEQSNGAPGSGGGGHRSEVPTQSEDKERSNHGPNVGQAGHSKTKSSADASQQDDKEEKPSDPTASERNGVAAPNDDKQETDMAGKPHPQHQPHPLMTHAKPREALPPSSDPASQFASSQSDAFEVTGIDKNPTKQTTLDDMVGKPTRDDKGSPTASTSETGTQRQGYGQEATHGNRVREGVNGKRKEIEVEVNGDGDGESGGSDTPAKKRKAEVSAGEPVVEGKGEDGDKLKEDTSVYQSSPTPTVKKKCHESNDEKSERMIGLIPGFGPFGSASGSGSGGGEPRQASRSLSSISPSPISKSTLRFDSSPPRFPSFSVPTSLNALGLCFPEPPSKHDSDPDSDKARDSSSSRPTLITLPSTPISSPNSSISDYFSSIDPDAHYIPPLQDRLTPSISNHSHYRRPNSRKIAAVSSGDDGNDDVDERNQAAHIRAEEMRRMDYWPEDPHDRFENTFERNSPLAHSFFIYPDRRPSLPPYQHNQRHERPNGSRARVEETSRGAITSSGAPSSPIKIKTKTIGTSQQKRNRITITRPSLPVSDISDPPLVLPLPLARSNPMPSLESPCPSIAAFSPLPSPSSSGTSNVGTPRTDPLTPNTNTNTVTGHRSIIDPNTNTGTDVDTDARPTPMWATTQSFHPPSKKMELVPGEVQTNSLFSVSESDMSIYFGHGDGARRMGCSGVMCDLMGLEFDMGMAPDFQDRH